MMGFFISCGSTKKVDDEKPEVTNDMTPTKDSEIDLMSWLNDNAINQEEMLFKFDEPNSKEMTRLKIRTQTADLSILSKLNKLKYLSLSGSSISNLTQINSLSSLQFLFVNDMNLQDNLLQITRDKEHPLYVLHNLSESLEVVNPEGVFLFDSNDKCMKITFQAILLDKISAELVPHLLETSMGPIFKTPGDPTSDHVGIVDCDYIRQ